ncbi:ABC transporter I family member 1 [Linum perenne]
MDWPIWSLDEPSIALDDDGLKLLEFIIADHKKKGRMLINIGDAMFLRLPPMFPTRMAFVDILSWTIQTLRHKNITGNNISALQTPDIYL